MRFWPDCDNSDEHVYHYTSLQSVLLILSSGRIRFGNICNANDPVELRRRVAWIIRNTEPDGDTVSIGKQAVKLLNANTYMFCCSSDSPSNEHREWLEQKRDEKGTVVPFESGFDDKGFNRMRMWAQYAENHSGVCFVLNKNQLTEAAEALASSEGFKCYSGRVHYGAIENCESRDPFMLEWDDYKNHDIRYAVESHVERNYKAEYFFKRYDWRDEHEYRWVLRGVKNGPAYVPIKNVVSAVILGHYFNPECEPSIRKLVSESLPIFRFSPSIKPLEVL